MNTTPTNTETKTLTRIVSRYHTIIVNQAEYLVENAQPNDSVQIAHQNNQMIVYCPERKIQLSVKNLHTPYLPFDLKSESRFGSGNECLLAQTQSRSRHATQQ